jgi:tetratricopeptide (TPR) repeat protein
MHRILIPVLAFLALPIAAQEPSISAHQQDGFNHFYNLEYDEALSDFEQAEKALPEDPSVHNNLAQTLLYREMFRNGALESELVSGNNAFLRRAKMNPPAAVQERFFAEISQAIALSQKRLGKNPNDIPALYNLGVSYGLESNYNFLVRKAWHEALGQATQARKMDDKVIELDPKDEDARLLPGVHDYMIGGLPWTVRALGFLAGFHGDKERGLRTLEEVARKGRSNKVDAEIILCALYRREGRPKSALPLAEDLLQRYPRNYLLLFEKAQMYSALGDKKNALETLQHIADLKQQGTPGFSRISWEKIYYEQGNIEFWYNDLDQALANLKKATSGKSELDLNTGVLAWMRQGQIYDLENHHDLARKAYQQAIAFAPEADAAKESKHYINDPYRRSKS